MPEFKEETYGKKAPVVVQLSRKQIEQMHQTISNFKDINNFELHISYDSGVKSTMNFRFSVDVTDSEKP